MKSFEEVDALDTSDDLFMEDLDEQAQQEWAMKISNYANMALLALKVSFEIIVVVM